MNANPRWPEVCPNLHQFAAGTAKAFLDEIARIQFSTEEQLYKVERRQMLAFMLQDDLNCYCEECMALEAIAGIVGDHSWSPRNIGSIERFSAARNEWFELLKKRHQQT